MPEGGRADKTSACALQGLCTIEDAKKSLSWFGENRSMLAAVGNMSLAWPVVQHAPRRL